ncbi:hypothetical protein BDY21DRAFT_153787 [Lineolata rhizophorae]|uniref:Uncharacterized protein n=1 Tax=Lineolata rhizophorae TaxID=578093 RepID=A0A6A6NM68_9PEZI|nr:hypothetical protein BDY21DRAFT_153787 [Lineolata rhizophorae]
MRHNQPIPFCTTALQIGRPQFPVYITIKKRLYCASFPFGSLDVQFRNVALPAYAAKTVQPWLPASNPSFINASKRRLGPREIDLGLYFLSRTKNGLGETSLNAWEPDTGFILNAVFIPGFVSPCYSQSLPDYERPRHSQGKVWPGYRLGYRRGLDARLWRFVRSLGPSTRTPDGARAFRAE